MQKNTLSYCGQLVKDSEPDLFLISMFAPSHVREALWALFAFYYEISKTREVVSESTLGLIRLQWWRDAIADIYTGKIVQAHEVLKPLAEAIVAYDLPQEDFDKLIYAREFDLEDVLPGNMEGLHNYADFTTTSFLRLAAIICGEEYDAVTLRSIAVRYRLAQILRNTGRYAHQGRCYFPEDLMNTFQVTRDDVYAYSKPEDVKKIVHSICHSMPDTARCKGRVQGAFAALSDIYLKQIRKCDCEVFSGVIHLEPPFKVLRLFWKTVVFS